MDFLSITLAARARHFYISRLTKRPIPFPSLRSGYSHHHLHPYPSHGSVTVNPYLCSFHPASVEEQAQELASEVGMMAQGTIVKEEAYKPNYYRKGGRAAHQ